MNVTQLGLSRTPHSHAGRNDWLALTVFKEVCDVQLQRGEDLVEHFKVLAKAGHLDDKAGGRLGWRDGGMEGGRDGEARGVSGRGLVHSAAQQRWAANATRASPNSLPS